MDFSVGTVDPYTLESGDGSQLETATGRDQHGQCNPILTSINPNDNTIATNTLLLGDTLAENSLKTDKTYSTHSYWRLSSNSSAGATVYYSGVTLSNTVGDKIQGMGIDINGDAVGAQPSRGTPQFGLALANGSNAVHGTDGQTPSTLDDPSTGLYPVDYTTETRPAVADDYGIFENGADMTANGLVNPLSQGVDATVATDVASQSLAGYHAPRLWPLIPEAAYDQGAGRVNNEYGGAPNTEFAFNERSNLIPEALASENSQVVDCVTAKIRYVANIAATTPAGIYTTKINYIAAPQY
jgi:hypothetical protein